ncbi:hypothetical protein [Kitasatospora sp. NPDC056184]
MSGVSAVQDPATAPGIVVEAHMGMLVQPGDGPAGIAVQDHMAL